MGTGNFQSSNRRKTPWPVRVIGLVLCAVAIAPPLSLAFAWPASARDGHEGHDGGRRFEQPKIMVAPQPPPQPPQQRQMRQDDQKQNASPPQRGEERGRQESRDGDSEGHKHQNSGNQSGSQSWSSGKSNRSGDGQPEATSQAKQTGPQETGQPTQEAVEQDQSDRTSRSQFGKSDSGRSDSGRSESDKPDSGASDAGLATPSGSGSPATGSSEQSQSGNSGSHDKSDNSWQSSKDNSATKTQRGDSSKADSRDRDEEKKSKDSKTTKRGDAHEEKPAPAQPTQQEDRSFGASTSLLDFFRRNTKETTESVAANPPTPVITPGPPVAAPIAPVVFAVQPDPGSFAGDGKPFGKTEVKPVKAVTTQPASLEKTVDKSTPADKTTKAVAHAPPVEIPFSDKTTFKPREIVASNFNAAQLQKAKSLGFSLSSQTLIGNLGLPSVQRLVVPAGMTETDAYALLKQEVPAATFSANHIYRILPAGEVERPASSDAAAVVPGANSPPCSGEKCFGPTLIGWTPEHRSCARHVRIGIIDTSFDLTHPAFAGHKFNNGNFLGDGATSARDWHGTAVLGLLAGDSRGGTPGLVPDAEFYLASAFRTDADGNASADTIGVLNALSWLEALDVKLINMSFSGPHDQLIEKAITVMSGNGVIFVAAAGNRGPNSPPSYPAAYSDVIAVTAVGKTLQGYRHANRGDYVDAAAPGVEVWTALPNAKEGFRTGTSFAAPFFTGIAATLPAIQTGKLRKADVLKQLAFQDLGPPGRDPVYGQGLAKVPEHCSNPAQIARGQTSPQQQPKMSVGAPPSLAPAAKRGTSAQAASGPSAR